MQRLADQVRSIAVKVEPLNDFQLALKEALGDRYAGLTLAPTSADPEIKIQVMRLINAVMVSSWLEVPVPMSIALRLIDRNHRAYQIALRQPRTIEERDVAEGLIELSARQQLEAALWCEKRVPQAEERFRLVREMVLKLKPGEAMNDWGLELQFARDLLYGIGPQGRFRDRTLYPKIADLIQELRRQCGRISPRLTLIEINATREGISNQGRYLRDRPPEQDLSAEERQRILGDWLPRLRQAEAGLWQAIDQVHPGTAKIPPGTSQMLVNLYTELACVLGTQQVSLLLLARPSPTAHILTEINSCLAAADRAWQQAIRYDEDATFAYDTACWVLRDHIDGLKTHLTEERKVELLARWEQILEEYRDLSLSESEYVKMERREADLQLARGNIQQFEQVLERLDSLGNSDASVLRARYIRAHEGAITARRFLEGRCPDSLLTDRTVLSYYYRLWWESETGKEGFFDQDYLVLPFREEQWVRLHELAEHRLQLEGEQDNLTALFHLGWAYLQINQPIRARETFDRLDTVSINSPRRARTLALLGGVDGTPRKLFGETRQRRSGDRGWAWVEDLRLEVPFQIQEFDLGPYRPGRPIGPFHLALNFRGMFAQATSRYRPQL